MAVPAVTLRNRLAGAIRQGQQPPRLAILVSAVAALLPLEVLAEDCEPFSKRRWGCDSLYCAIVDAFAIPVSAVPRYDLSFGDGRIRQGLSWQIAVAVAPGERSCHRWEHDLAVEGAIYPFGDIERDRLDWAFRTTWRTWIPGNRNASSEEFTLRFGGGLGAFVGLGGVGPRLETRIWLGSAERMVRTIGVFVSGAYEPDLYRMKHRGQVSAGIEFPINI
jgi:hypothetical protein